MNKHSSFLKDIVRFLSNTPDMFDGLNRKNSEFERNLKVEYLLLLCNARLAYRELAASTKLK